MLDEDLIYLDIVERKIIEFLNKDGLKTNYIKFYFDKRKLLQL
jgi:hypothetical protein